MAEQFAIGSGNLGVMIERVVACYLGQPWLGGGIGRYVGAYVWDVEFVLGLWRDDDVGEDKGGLSRKEGFDRWIPLAFTMRWE